MRLPSRKFVAIGLFALVLVYLLGTWLLLPRLLQSQAERYVAEQTGHRLAMDRPEFNPFTLQLRLRNLRLAEPNGAALLAFKELLVDLSATSLVRAAWVFDAIRLDGLDASVVELPGNRLNWSSLLESLQGKPAPPTTTMPRVEIADLRITASRLELADRRSAPGFATRIEPLDLHFQELSTLPRDKGRYRLAAHTDFGASLIWQGELALNPLAVTGHFDLAGASLAKLPLHLAAPEGTVALSADYRFAYSRGQIDLGLDHVAAKLTGFKLRARQDATPLLSLDTVTLNEGRFDLRQATIAIGSISGEGGHVDLVRDAAGHLNVLDLLPAPDRATRAPVPTPPRTAVETASAGWHYRVDRVALTGLGAGLRDQKLTPAAQLALSDINVSVEGLSDNLAAPWPVRASFNAATGGRLELEGTVIAATPSVDAQIKLSEWSLKPVQPYLGAATTLTLANGSVSADGKVRYGPEGTGYSGSLAINKLRLTEAGSKTDFMAWSSLATRKLDVTPEALQVGELVLTGLDTQLIIAQDRTINLSRAFRTLPGTPAPATPQRNKAAPAYRVDIERLRVAASEMDFADHSLALPFGSRIHHLHGTIDGLSTQTDALGRIALDGQVDDYGLARATGQIKLLDPTDAMDIRVIFRNIEMTRLTPYSATFAGRKIRSGKLSLDLGYQLKQRQLVGDNKVIMDKLVLGERVESPQAKDLPLDLAIALLEDADGRIDLGLPVSGSLDDPQFSFGGIVWKAIVNTLSKIVTAPFRALASLFGGDGEALEHVVFEPGRMRLAPPEREKLARLAASLGKRPALALTIHGTYAESDRVALQDQQLRRMLARKLGYQVEDQRDPGPIATAQPKVQAALEDQFAEQFGGDELAVLKDGFRQANPDQLKQSTTGKLISRLRGAFREKRELSAQEVAQLKGADFHALLYQRLRDKQTVADAQLLALATTRGENAIADLKAAGAPLERVNLAAPEKVDSANGEIPLKIEVATARKLGE